MGRQLASRLNELIDAQDADRAAVIEQMAQAAGIEAGTVNQILDGSIDCPPLERLDGFAQALGSSTAELREAAEADGCAYQAEASAGQRSWWPFGKRPAPPGTATQDPATPPAITLEGRLDLQAAAGDRQPLPKLHIIANTGQPMRLENLPEPVVVDLAGVTFDRESTPIILDHDPARRIGHTTSQRADQAGIEATVSVSSSMRLAAGIVEDLANGFPFQASIGADVLKSQLIRAGETVTVNGRQFTGPLVVARQARVREISIVTLGGDSSTSVALAASRKRNGNMSAENQDIVATEAANIRRIGQIKAAMPRYHNVPGVEELAALAIESGATSDQFELQCIHKFREQAPAFSVARAPVIDETVLQCQAHRAIFGDRFIEKAYKPETLEASDRLPRGGILDVYRTALQAAGRWESTFIRDKYAMIRAASSTTSVSNVLTDAANKELAQIYQSIPSVARTVARIDAANDFKTHNFVALSANMSFQEVGGDGEIKHKEISDRNQTARASQYAIMASINREQLVNDDASAFADMPRMLAFGAEHALAEKFWQTVLDNTWDNQITVALDADGLASAVQKLREQTDGGKPVFTQPRYLIVTPKNEVIGRQLLNSTEKREGLGDGATADQPTANVFSTMNLELMVESWLAETGPLTGPDDDDWYLVSDPAVLAFMRIIFLGGVTRPRIEQEDESFERLGVRWRGLMDFGVAVADEKAAVESDVA